MRASIRTWHGLALLLCTIAGATACTADDEPNPDPDPRDGGFDYFGQSCPAFKGNGAVHAAGFEVREAGEAKPGKLRAATQWTAGPAGEVLRISLAVSQDPSPSTIDDEIAYEVVLDLVPSEALRQDGRETRIDQTFEVTADEFYYPFYPDNPRVKVTRGAEDSGLVRRLTVMQSCYCSTQQDASYHVTGTLALDPVGEGRFKGVLALEFDGDLLFTNDGPHSLTLAGCFDVEPAVQGECSPGQSCGQDCLPPDDYVCGACGELYLTHDCQCRPDLPPLAECAGPARATEGEACGHWWWCDRLCKSGLECKPDPSYGPHSDDDAGIPLDACEYHSCQQP